MEIRHLNLIKAIVEEGSISKAINKLHLTSSALSHQLKEAELQLGTRIFFRMSKKLILTPAGEKLYESSKIILGELERVESDISQLVRGERALIRLSTECYTSYHWLPSVLKHFKEVCPGIDVKVIVQSPSRPIQKLLEGEIDLAITNDPISNNNIEFIELFKDEMCAIVSDEHHWAEREYISAADFSDENLIVHSEPLETVIIYKKLLQPNGISPKNITILPLTEAAIEMIKADMGVMVLPKWTVQAYVKTGEIKLVKVTPEGMYRIQYAAIAKAESYPDYMNHFVKFLRDELFKRQ